MEAEEEGTEKSGVDKGQRDEIWKYQNMKSPWSCSRAEVGKMSVLLVQRNTYHKLHNYLFQEKKSYK